jgi:diacylglycerol kinase (ATP)
LRITLIIRPREGMQTLEALRSHVAELRRRGHEVSPHLTFEEGDARRMAAAAAHDGAHLVIAAGGDGTINETVNGVMATEWSGRLGVIPLGTANDFAAGLEIPQDLDEAFGVALAGAPREVDVARVNDRYFINVSTGGFGANATEETPSETKKLLGPWAYVITGVKKFSELRPSQARFERPDGVAFEGPVMLFAVGNAKRTGGGTMLTPRADFQDGELDVMIVPGMPRMDFLALLPDLRAGTHLDNPDVLYFRTPRLGIRSGEPLSVNADGEPVGGESFEYGIADRPLTLMVP